MTASFNNETTMLTDLFVLSKKAQETGKNRASLALMAAGERTAALAKTRHPLVFRRELLEEFRANKGEASRLGKDEEAGAWGEAEAVVVQDIQRSFALQFLPAPARKSADQPKGQPKRQAAGHRANGRGAAQ